MIATSDKWKTAHLETLLPETFVEITYDVTEPGVQSSATESNDGAAYFSDHTAIVETTPKSFKLYATLENNLWGLSGEHELVPDNAPYGDTGYVSRSAVQPTSTPVVTISFSKKPEQLIPGITITWSSRYGEYASRFRVSAYDGTTQLALQEFTNSSVKTVCNIELYGYTEIRIEVLEWSLPGHRARIERVVIGVSHTYAKGDLLRYKHTQTGDLLSAELPKNAIAFSLDNSNGMWNPDNLSGYVKYLAERQQVTVRYGMKLDDDIEWVDAGTFWMSEWETPSNGLEVMFVARDVIEFLSDTYNGPKKGTLYEIAKSAFEQADIPLQDNGKLRYVISDNLKEWSIDFSEDKLPYTLGEIVQLCANAACCVMYQDRAGILHIEPLREGYSGHAIRGNISYAYPEFKLTKILKSVSVNGDMGKATNDTKGEIQTLSNSLIKSETMANRVAEWVKEMLKGRRTVMCAYRADPTMDVFDKIAIESKYGLNSAVYVTEVEYTYNGTFHGKVTGRIADFDAEKWYSGELKSGEV